MKNKKQAASRTPLYVALAIVAVLMVLDVILPVPGKPKAKPTKKLITLTTCTPKYSASHRLIVDGVLESALPKSASPPPALKGG